MLSKKNKGFEKRLVKAIKIFLKKKKSISIVVIAIKIFLKMKRRIVELENKEEIKVKARHHYFLRQIYRTISYELVHEKHSF